MSTCNQLVGLGRPGSRKDQLCPKKSPQALIKNERKGKERGGKGGSNKILCLVDGLIVVPPPPPTAIRIYQVKGSKGSTNHCWPIHIGIYIYRSVCI